jgi:hypothetical protein
MSSLIVRSAIDVEVVVLGKLGFLLRAQILAQEFFPHDSRLI